MLQTKDFNSIVLMLENKYFLKQKKKLKLIRKFIINYKFSRVDMNIYKKLKEYWFIFVRLESLFGNLPKIKKLNTKRKGKIKKKIIFLRSKLSISAVLFNEKKADIILNYIFYFHNYLYINFLIKNKHKINKLEEFIRHFVKKFIYVQHNSVSFFNNLYFRWLDLNRKFIHIKGKIYSSKYKLKKNFSNKQRRIKFYNSRLSIISNYYKFFLLPIKILLKNYRKLIIYLFKKLRKKKKAEKAHILL